jgi:hypothetical protein
MKDLLKVEDPDAGGGLTLKFSDGGELQISVGPDGKLVAKSTPE